MVLTTIIGLVLGLVTIIVYRKMTNKTPIEISGRMILTVIAGILGTLIRHVLHDGMEQHGSGNHPRPYRNNHPADAHSACERN